MISKNIEYEKRVVISKQDYDMILNTLVNFPKKEYIIFNIYYDLKNITLIPQGFLFRLRNNNANEFEFTLKEKSLFGDNEYNIPLTQQQFLEYSSYSYLSIPEELKSKIKVNVPNNILYKKCTLQTKRIEIQIDDYTLILDENSYNGIVDFDLEVEASSMPRATEVFNDLMKTYRLSSKNTKGKSSRAISTIK